MVQGGEVFGGIGAIKELTVGVGSLAAEWHRSERSSSASFEELGVIQTVFLREKSGGVAMGLWL